MKHSHAGQLVSQGHYRSFLPSPINRPWALDDMELIELLGQADRELGRLDMHSEYIPDIDLFVGMHVLEATQSSRIEGTQTKMDERSASGTTLRSKGGTTGKKSRTMSQR